MENLKTVRKEIFDVLFEKYDLSAEQAAKVLSPIMAALAIETNMIRKDRFLSKKRKQK